MDTPKLPLLASVIVCQLLACSSASSGNSHARLPIAAAPDAGEAPDAGGQCVRSTHGLPVDAHRALLGVKPGELLEAMVGEHRIAFDWQPWWQAPPPVPDVRSYTVEITASGSPYSLTCPLHLAADVMIDIRDATGALAPTFIGVIEAWAPGQFSMQAEFRAPQLAAALALPQTDGEADSFVFSATQLSGRWQAALGSRRHTAVCPLFDTPPPQADDCSPFIPQTGASHLATLSTELADGALPSDLLAEFDKDLKRYVHWRDGTSSTLTLDVTSKGFACVGRDSNMPSADDNTYTPRWRAVVPVDVQLGSADRRLQITLPGYVSAEDAPDGWRQATVLNSLLVPAADPLLDSGSLGFNVIPAKLNLLTFSLSDDQTPTSPGFGNIGFSTYEVDEGLPDFPDVRETTLARATCFGTASATALTTGPHIDQTR